MSSPTYSSSTIPAHAMQNDDLLDLHPAVGMKRSRDTMDAMSLSLDSNSNDSEDTDDTGSMTSSTAMFPGGRTSGTNNGGLHKKSRRLEPSSTLRSEEELQSFLNGEHPMLRPGKNTEDFSAVLIVHCQWNKPQFSIPDTVHRYGAMTTTFQMTALPSLSVFCVDVDAIGVAEASELLELVTYPLPAMLMYRFTPFKRAPNAPAPSPLAAPAPKFQAAKVVEKSLWEQRNDEEAMLKVVRSASLVEPVHSLTHLQDRLQRQPDGTYTILWYSASWCPPCRRVAESIPEIITRIPNNVVQIIKADKDQTQSLYDHFGVQKIPTFQIFKNGPSDAKPGFTAKGSLQNSQATQVISFIDTNTATLKFGMGDDEDF